MTGRWLTPNAPPEHKQYTRPVKIPASLDFIAPISGALAQLTYATNWEKHGDLTPDETAAIYSGIYQEFLHFQNEPPVWETPDDIDGQPEQVWYEELSDWIIAGFLAITFTPLAALTYQSTVPKLRIAIRTGNLGALFKVLINGIEVWTGDSYSAITDLIEQTFDMSAETEPYTVRIEHNGQGIYPTGDAKLEVVREGVLADMIQTILRADPTGCGIQWSLDNGDNWETIDLATCITDLANGAIGQAIDDGLISTPGQQSPGTPPESLECNSYHVELRASDRWHSPIALHEGWTVEVTNVHGGWSDGTPQWNCPDGARYLLGECSEQNKSHEETDPDPTTLYHMQLIGVFGVDTDIFDPTTLYTLTSEPVDDMFFQANDGSLSDNQGSISFDVEICNQSVNYCENFNTLFDSASDYHGWRAMTTGEIGLRAYYGGTSDDWRMVYNSGIEALYGEGYQAGNYGIAAVYELSGECHVASVIVHADCTAYLAQNYVSVWVLVGSTWTAIAAEIINQNANHEFVVDTDNVSAIAIASYGAWALAISEVNVTFE